MGKKQHFKLRSTILAGWKTLTLEQRNTLELSQVGIFFSIFKCHTHSIWSCLRSEHFFHNFQMSHTLNYRRYRYIFRHPRMSWRELKRKSFLIFVFVVKKSKYVVWGDPYSMKGLEIASLSPANNPQSILISTPIWGVVQLPRIYYQWYPLSPIYPCNIWKWANTSTSIS